MQLTTIDLVVFIAFMALVVVLMRGLYGLRQTGTIDYSNAVGEVASVYLPVPPKMSGPGQVEVTVQGRLRVVPAFTRSAARIPNGTRVKVVETMDRNTLVVEPLAAAPAGEEQETPS